MNAEKYWKICMDDNTYVEDGLHRCKIQRAMKQWAERFPQESFALVKREAPTSRNGWVHLILPAFYVDTYAQEHRYEPDTWYAITGNYEKIMEQSRALCEANRNRWLNG